MLIDISVTIEETMLCWPGVMTPTVSRHKSIRSGDAVNDRNMYFNLHTGTHIDAENHFFDNGGTIEQIDLDVCCGKAYVLEVEGDVIDKGVIEKHGEILSHYERVLFKTSNTGTADKAFREDFTALDESGARAILAYSVRLIGIDYLSVQKFGQENNRVHQLLLENKVVLLESLDLRGVEAGEYELFAFPVKIKGVEAAPVRAVLKR